MLKETEKRELEKLLIDEKEKIEKELHGFTVDSPESPGGHEVITARLNEKEVNPEDQASQEEEFFRLKSLENILEQRLEEIIQALEKIQKDDFGICEKCQQEISWARLKVNPAAKTCVNCFNL